MLIKLIFIVLIISSLPSCGGGKKTTNNPAMGGGGGDSSGGSSTIRYWNTSDLPLTIRLSDHFDANASSPSIPIDETNDNDADGDNIIEQMAKKWNAIKPASSPDFFVVQMDYVDLRSAEGAPADYVQYLESGGVLNSGNTLNFDVYVIDSNWPSADLGAGTLAVTLILATTSVDTNGNNYDRMFDIDFMVNNDTFNFRYKPPTNSDYHLPTIMLHEFGHALGILHPTDTTLSTVMQASVDSNTVLQNLGTYEQNEINTRYDTTSIVAQEIQDAQDMIGAKSVLIKTELYPNGLCMHYRGDQLYKVHISSINNLKLK